jgi:hypothetical protein
MSDGCTASISYMGDLDYGKAPESIARLDGLAEIPVPPKVPGIYFLCLDGRVVYVGQSIDVYGRVLYHRTDKDFDSAFFIASTKENLNDVERFFIKYLMPELNKHMNPSVV